MDAPGPYLSADKRRAVTVSAVVDIAATQNPADITTAAIAKHMNVTQGALFRHFPSKEAIWRSVMEWVAERLLARLDAATTGIGSPLVALEAMFNGHVDFVSEHPGVPRMMFGELQRAEVTPAKRMAETLMRQYGERVAGWIEKGKAAGEIAPETDPRSAAALFIGIIQGLVMQSLLTGDPGHVRRAAPGVFHLFRRGIAILP